MRRSLRTSISRAALVLLFSPIARPDDRSPAIPKAWDDEALAGWHIPLAMAGGRRVLSASRTKDLQGTVGVYRVHDIMPVEAPMGDIVRLALGSAAGLTLRSIFRFGAQAR
jgi:hypothetical protein